MSKDKPVQICSRSKNRSGLIVDDETDELLSCDD